MILFLSKWYHKRQDPCRFLGRMYPPIATVLEIGMPARIERSFLHPWPYWPGRKCYEQRLAASLDVNRINVCRGSRSIL